MKFFDKVNKIKISSSQKFELFPFCHNSKFLDDFPIKWGMTFKKAGSMRFSWNEENLLRDKILSEISEKYFEKQILPVSDAVFFRYECDGSGTRREPAAGTVFQFLSDRLDDHHRYDHDRNGARQYLGRAFCG